MTSGPRGLDLKLLIRATFYFQEAINMLSLILNLARRLSIKIEYVKQPSLLSLYLIFHQYIFTVYFLI
jgi:hypothetical protein